MTRGIEGMASNATPISAHDLPDPLLEEAALWHARMHEPAVSEDRRAAFARWLAADALHAAAYAETDRLWSALEAPVARVMAEQAAVKVHRPVARRRMAASFGWGALAAGMLLALAGGLSWRNGVFDDWRSDYATATGARRTITLADGSEVTLNTDSALAVAFTPGQRDVHLYRGEAWFDVTHNAARPFIVETPEGNVRVTGTRFNVRLAQDAAIVSLVEGRVELTAEDAAGKAVVLAPGEQGIIRAPAVGAPGAFDANAVTAWRRGQLVFYQMPLADVVDQLNRYWPGRILLANPALRGMKVTGVFDADDPAAALSVIQNTLHISALHIAKFLILLH